jgi:hypothetical protein
VVVNLIHTVTMSSKAGPSKSKTPKVAKAVVPAVAPVKNLSNENVESDDDLESRDQGDDDSSSSEEEDSDEDLEDIQPKQKSTAQTNGNSKQSGSAWPYVFIQTSGRKADYPENINHLMGWHLLMSILNIPTLHSNGTL